MKKLHLLAALLMVGIMTVGVTTWYAKAQAEDKVVTTTYFYDTDQERWLKTSEVRPTTQGEKKSNTIIIRVDADNPVKEIEIEEALIIGGTEPLLDIKGHDTGGTTGVLNIGTLKFDTVDAKELDIDADVVRSELDNAVANDNELDLNLQVVNVVRTGRGASSSLFLGKGPTAEAERNNSDTNNHDEAVVTGLRVDRIRILGPNTGAGFIEKITVLNSSVFGRIEVDDVAIQDLIIRNVSLDDGI